MNTNKNFTNQTQELQQVHHSLKFSKKYGTTNKTNSTKQDEYLPC
jgi:hypothetical protein